MIVSTLVLALAASVPQAAPWPVSVEAELGSAPERVTLYAPLPGAIIADMHTLQRVFSMPGQAEFTPDLGGLDHIGRDDIHLVVFADGGAHYHDLVVMKSDQAMADIDDSVLWQDSAALLEALELLADGPVHLEPAGTGFVEHFEIDPDTGETNIRQSHQGVTWLQVIDGLPSFGPGSETEVLYGDGGAIAAFHHAQRPLRAVGVAPVLDPAAAVDAFLLDADETGAWNHYKAAIGEVDHVHVGAAELGYYVPGRGESTGTPYQPVYEITGTIHGVDPLGEPTTIDLLWYQPALRSPAGPRCTR